MELLFPLGTALILGFAHALEADHMAAVGSFVVRRPRPAEAMFFGARWAAGHGAAILLVGTLLVLLRAELPAGAGEGLETLVGISLIGLGLWNLWGVPRLHVHPHRHADGVEHTHLHSHRRTDGHGHRHAVTAMGALHGLAGTAPAVAIIPLAASATAAGAAGFLLVFAIGTAAAMAVFAMAMGVLVHRVGSHSTAVARGLTVLTGLATVVIGVLWL